MDLVEQIERATLAAVPPQACEERAGWLLPLDRGTVGRAHSAVPLSHAAPDLAVLPQLEAHYRAFGIASMLRLPEVAAFDAMREHLGGRGYARSKATDVMVARVEGLAPGVPSIRVELDGSASTDWMALFLGDGFDPHDGASRSEILRRGTHSVFASVRVDGEVVAVGAGCYSHGWCGIHGMRTRAPHRGRGFAGAIVAALAQEAGRRGIGDAFLQVEAANARAAALYARAGFKRAWRYAYWTAA